MINKKIVFFDIDGTLIGKTGQISQKNIQAIQRLRKNGHYAFLCTGRSYNYLSQSMIKQFDGFICCAGAYIEVEEKTIYEKHLPIHTVSKIKEVFDKNNIEYDHECIGFDYLTELFLDKIYDNEDKNIKEKNITKLKEENVTTSMNNYDGSPILKLSYVADNIIQIENAKKELNKEFDFAINPSFSGKNISGDLMPKNVNKGTAIRKVIEYLNISIDDTLCFGDSDNDIEMFKTCANSIAMGNGTPEIKKIASSVCENVDDDGIFYELERRNLI